MAETKITPQCVGTENAFLATIFEKKFYFFYSLFLVITINRFISTFLAHWKVDGFFL